MRLFSMAYGVAPALLLLLSHCGSSGGGDANGSNSLVRLDDEPAGENCPAGGVAILAGLDDNGNGTLDDNEVDSREYVCDGGGSHSMLISVEEEPAGEFCVAGGLVVYSGFDVNDDGALGDDEVTVTEYICHGEAGRAERSLVDVAEEPEGENCGVGGLVIRSGIDTNGDGELQPEEVTSTEYVCDGRPGSGLNSLVAVSEEPPGEHCPSGGQAIQTGMDDNSDGLLQPAEVDNLVYVCDGSGLTSLVRLADEPPGRNCEHGGQAVMTGLDDDGDGTLDADEVTSTSYVCDGAAGETGETGHSGVFDVDEIDPGAVCAEGGFTISTGIDLDDDGALDADEVRASETICHGEDGATGGDGTSALVAVAVEPAGARCARGGQRIDVGLDDNANGTLDAGEVDSTSYVCNGSAGLNSLVEVTDEPAGAACPAGGLRVDSGLDDDGDGDLEATEIDSTEYICNGAGGAWAVRVRRAAWGGVCPRGGVLLQSGRDDDGDGVLDDGEVDTNEYLCNLYYVQITGGNNHTCALASDGRVRCWGYNVYGQLGDGSTTNYSFPVLVEGLMDVASIDAGSNHTCALQTDGDLYCWGYNGYGQIGDGTTTNRYRAVHIASLEDAVEVSAGENHTCARISGGAVRCWGYSGYGQIGDGTTTNRYFPTAVAGLAGTLSVAAGGNHSCVVLSSGRVRCWGYNGYGQLGDATSTHRYSPVDVGVVVDATTVTAGQNHSCVRRSGGAGYCWGYNGYGQLGDASTSTRYSPVGINGLSTMSFLTAGYDFTCAILADETSRCWGYNGHGELGDGTSTSRNVAVEVVFEEDGRHFGTGQYHACLVRNEGRAFCWGYNGYGQLGNGTTTSTLTPTAVFLDHSL
jgi:alpha-tubulin suppressor-like RCC1 family protein